MSTQPETTLTLFGAKDSTGRLYLVDRRDYLPSDAQEITVFPIAPDKVEWAILRVQLEEIRLIPVTIHVGDYEYASRSRSALPPEPRDRAGEVL